MANAGVAPESLRTPNPSHYVDYQDCKRRATTDAVHGRGRTARCRGRGRFSGLAAPTDRCPRSPPAVRQSPVLLWTPSGLDMTHNAVGLSLRLQGSGIFPAGGWAFRYLRLRYPVARELKIWGLKIGDLLKSDD